MKRIIVTIILALAAVMPSYCCTSLIISGKATKDGRPLMMKNRDTGELNNRFERFQGPVYAFIGLVDSPSEGGVVWSGMNSAGFCIMNTASYNIKYDDVPDSEMDKEGEVMYEALGTCATLSDFEKLLDKRNRPMGVEANFGVIDAQGGAAYYEVNNASWIKYDVNEIPEGYRVVTNFSESGKVEDYMGYERYLTASAVMKEIYESSPGGIFDIDHNDLYWKLSRSYRHELIGIDYLGDYDSLVKNYGFNGVVVDQDFIPRKSTSASVVFEGVVKGGNPDTCVMWGILGYPACSFSVPMIVSDEDLLPSYLKKNDDSMNSILCDKVLDIKGSEIFRFDISNGSKYLDLNNVIKYLNVMYSLESSFYEEWKELYDGWCNGKISSKDFKKSYSEMNMSAYKNYLSEVGK